ncbi:hypothetical protein CS542_09730 [Pedobacter sp. IW39]|nr:hypothetical protein CS542_09730 [Pedobacter sp. IW39]
MNIRKGRRILMHITTAFAYLVLVTWAGSYHFIEFLAAFLVKILADITFNLCWIRKLYSLRMLSSVSGCNLFY